MASGYLQLSGALYNIVFIYQDQPIFYQFLVVFVPILDLHFLNGHQIVQ